MAAHNLTTNEKYSMISREDDGEHFRVSIMNIKQDWAQRIIHCPNYDAPGDVETSKAVYHFHMFAGVRPPAGCIQGMGGIPENPPRRWVYSATPQSERKSDIRNFTVRRDQERNLVNRRGSLSSPVDQAADRTLSRAVNIPAAGVMVPLPEVDDLQAQIAQLTGQVQNEQAQRQQADHARAMAVQQEQHTHLLYQNEQTARNLLQTQVNALNASLATSQGERDAAHAQVDGLRTRVDNMRDELDEARDGLGRSSQMITSMQEALLELEGKTDPGIVSPKAKRTLARVRQLTQDSEASDGSEE